MSSAKELSADDRALFAGSRFCWLGKLSFDAALAANRAAVAAVASGKGAQLLAFEPIAAVYTLGLRAQTPQGRLQLVSTIELCRLRGIEVRNVERGGLGTLHLPGQLVIFLALPCTRIQLRPLVCALLRAASAAAAQWGVATKIDSENAVGLWHASGKLASLGLRERAGIVQHGLSFNAAIESNTAASLDLCGTSSTRFASLADLTLDPLCTPTAVARAFAQVLQPSVQI